MCGILGYIGKGPNEVVFSNALRMMMHRGPDSTFSREFKNPETAKFGMNRLSIVDIQNGSQPYTNEEQNIHVIFNGEIYNHEELRFRLETLGHSLNNASDGEVISHLYEEYGVDFLLVLEGMFAIALYDTAEGKLVLARDRFGEKPLFYSITEEALYFSSEIGALRKLLSANLSSISAENGALASCLGFFPSPTTVFSNISSLEPGKVLTRQDGETKVFSYWKPLMSGSQADLAKTSVRTSENLVDLIDEELSDSVEKRIPREVPFGIFLSGGIDSALVARAVARLTSSVPAYIMRFSEDKYDESGLAALTSKRFGMEARLVDWSHEAFIDQWKSLPSWMDFPNFDPSIFPTAQLARAAAEEVKVVLTGDGGDELFGGYPKYPLMDQIYKFGKLLPRFVSARSLTLENMPERLRRIAELLNLSWDSPAQYSYAMNSNNFFPHELKLGISSFPNALREINSWEFSDSTTWLDLDLRLNLEGILQKLDTATMASSLEARSPFLSLGMYDLARKFPSRSLYSRRETKIPLRKLAAQYLPSEISKAPKRGFTPNRRSMILAASECDIGIDIGDGESLAEQILSINIPTARWRAMVRDPIGRDDRKVWALLILNRWLSAKGRVIIS